MKLDAYTANRIQEQISHFLFIKWLKSDLNDWEDAELRELWLLYHEIFAKQVKVID